MNITAKKFLPRGCGEARIAGNAYLRSLKRKREDKDDGDPADYFLICPPYEVDLIELGLSAQGIRVLPDPNDPTLYHVWDLVGAEHYTPADFVEEDKQSGTSRLVPKPQINQLDLLTPGKSRHFFVAKTLLYDAKPIYDILDDTRIKMCPANHESHNSPNGDGLYQMCTSFLWETVDTLPKKNRRLHQIFMPRWMAKKDDEYMWSYFANGWYKHWEPLEFVYAAFYWKPVDKVEIVKDNTEEKKHLDVVQLAMSLCNDLPFVLIDDETGEEESIER